MESAVIVDVLIVGRDGNCAGELILGMESREKAHIR